MGSCGAGCWRPHFLRRFSNARCFGIMFGVLGLVQSAGTLYFALTLTTIEKRFKIPSQTTGITLSGNETSQIMLSLFLTYFGGQRNRPRWIAWGVVLGALSCFMLAVPHYIYGAGEDALLLTKEYVHVRNVSTALPQSEPIEYANSKLCTNTSTHHADDCKDGHEEFTYLPLIVIFMSQFVLGIGHTMYYSLGQSYLDDNTEQRNTPLMLGYAFAMRMCGPIIGFVVSYFIMNAYIDPRYTPTIPRDSPQWLGAYWLGWNVFGAIQLLLAVIIGLFPKHLTRRKHKSAKSESDDEKGYRSAAATDRNDSHENAEWKNFPAALMRLLKNKLVIFNNLAGIFFILSATIYMTFIGRVMEVQFNTSAHSGSILTGPSTILGMSIGILSSGYIISKYKPPPKYLFLWNAVIAMVSTSSHLLYTQIGCNGDASLILSGTMTSCNTNCRCDGISYSPVCDQTAGITYFSPCHAGCKTFDKEANRYTDCSCSDRDAYNETVSFLQGQYDQATGETRELAMRNVQQPQRIDTPSSCASDDCKSGFYIFAGVSLISGMIGATGRIGNLLLSFRAVERRDKSFAQGLTLFAISLFALIPGPIIYGRLIDNTCSIWNYECGRRGDCQLYDPIKFRHYLHGTSAFFLFMAVLFDLLVWHYGKNLDLYGDNEAKTTARVIEKGEEDDELAESQPLKKLGAH